jgi:hypothetical protein
VKTRRFFSHIFVCKERKLFDLHPAGLGPEPCDTKSQNAAIAVCRISKECVEVARAQGEPGILEIALNAAARVRTDCPLEAAAVGL